MKKDIIIEPQEFLPRIEEDIKQRFPIVIFFLCLMLILRIAFQVSLPDTIFILVSLLILAAIPIDFLILRIKEKKPQAAINLYFSYLLLDLSFLTLIINFVGGITWILPGVYLLYITTLFWLFPKTQAIFITAWINVLLALMIFGNFFQILPSFEIFSEQEKTLQNFPFILTSTLVSLAVIGFLGYSGDGFRRILNQKIEALREKEEELKQTKKFLENEVTKRTNTFWQERKKIAKEVEKKTQNLQEKKRIVETTLKELEKFHNIAVTRELKMAQLKEKISELKEIQSKR